MSMEHTTFVPSFEDEAGAEEAVNSVVMLRGSLEQVLPAEILIDRQAFVDFIEEQVQVYRSLYNHKKLSSSATQSMVPGNSLAAVDAEAILKLSPLDEFLPIKKTPQEIIPWAATDAELATCEIEQVKPRLTWFRFVKEMGKKLSEEFPP